MSKLFYDKHIDLSGVEKEIKKAVTDKESQEELFHLVDEIVHHRVVGCILDRLPDNHHEEFIDKVTDHPHDEGIFGYLGERIAEDISEFIHDEVNALKTELLELVADTNPKSKK